MLIALAPDPFVLPDIPALCRFGSADLLFDKDVQVLVILDQSEWKNLLIVIPDLEDQASFVIDRIGRLGHQFELVFFLEAGIQPNGVFGVQYQLALKIDTLICFELVQKIRCAVYHPDPEPEFRAGNLLIGIFKKQSVAIIGRAIDRQLQLFADPFDVR